MESGSNNRTMIVVAVVAVVALGCCCALLAVIGWFYGDAIVQQLGLAFMHGAPLI